MNKERTICLLEGGYFGDQLFLLSLVVPAESHKEGLEYKTELKDTMCANCNLLQEESCGGIKHSAYIDDKKIEIMQSTIIPLSNKTLNKVKKDCVIYQKFNQRISSKGRTDNR